MQILLLCDDHWHPGQIPADGVTPLEQNGYQFDIIKNTDDFSPDILNRYPIVIICKMDAAETDAMQKAFINYVENGGGLLAVHSAVVQEKSTQEFEKLIGCRFLGHPNPCPVTVQPVKPHPVTEGVGLFCEIDEHYKIEITAPDADVLLAS